MKKIKILMLNCEFPPIGGGAATATWYLLKEFSKIKNIYVDLITSSPSNEFQLEAVEEHINIHKLPIGKHAFHYWTQMELLKYSWRSYNYIKKALKENEYDLCHAFFGIPCGAIAQRFKKNLPYIVSLRGSDVPGFNPRFAIQYKIFKTLINKIWSDARAVVANSQGLKELALRTRLNQDIIVIPNGVDTEKFHPLKKRKTNEMNLLCVSRFIKRKNIDLLIITLSIVMKKYPNIKLILVGEGPLEQDLKNLTKKLGIFEKVEFKGRIPHEKIHEVYQNSHIFILLSHSEGMSNAILEAMASGLLIITTDTGGTSELIKGNGIIISKLNPEKIANIIIKILEDPILMEKMSKKSRSIAKKFNWKSMAYRYLDLYQKSGVYKDLNNN